MANSIGGIAFISIMGHPDKPGQQLEPIPAPYRSGNAYRKSHVRGDEVELIATRDCTNLAAADTLEDNCKTLQGTVDDIVKDGETFSDYVIVRVNTRRKQQGSVGVGGVTPHGTALLEMSFIVADGAAPR